MKLYLKNRVKDFEIKQSYKKIAVITIILLVILIIINEIIINKGGDEKGMHPLFYIIFVLFALFIANYNFSKKQKISFKSTDIEIIKIIFTFLINLKTNQEVAKKIIFKIFNIYSTNELNKIFAAHFNKVTDFKSACIKLSIKTNDVKLFVIYTLFDISAINMIFSLHEEEFIKEVYKLLRIHPDTYQYIKNSYIKQGLQEERKIIEERNRKKLAESFLPYNAYKVLGILPTVTKAQLKKVYRTLAKKYHPDKYYGQSEELIEKAEDKFQEITHAYEIIIKYKKFK